MSIEHLDRIDAIGTTTDGKIQLTISDHLDWQNEELHSELLQDKIFAYLEFIENGQLGEVYPESLNKKIAISLSLNHSPSESGLSILNKIKTFFDGKEIDFYWEEL